MKPSAMNKPDERLVYLALRPVFTGEDAKIRTPKAVRKQIRKHKEKQDVEALMKNHSADHIYNTTKELLEDRVFESTLYAKLRFPEVFRGSPAQSALREISEEEAARSEATAIKQVVEGHTGLEPLQTGNETPVPGHEFVPAVRLNDFDNSSVVPPSELEPAHESKKTTQTPLVPSLYPVYLPFATQHRLLNKLQNIMEKSCFSFGESFLNELLKERNWDCPERVELNIWSRTLKKSMFPEEDIDRLGKPLAQVLESIAHLRHTAVHRIQVSVNRVLEFLTDAERLATLLGDDIAVAQITRQQGALELTVEEMKRNKEFLSFRATETVRDLHDKIEELKRLQNAAIQEMFDEDKVFRQLAVADLETAIDVRASKQRAEDDREDDVALETGDNVESLSDVETEDEKQDSLDDARLE